MKKVLTLAILLFSFSTIFAQSELSPMVEKEFKYKDWTYKSASDGKEINLRQFIANKKLVLVVYFAPWCKNWRYEAPIVEKLYKKYKDKGFDVIGVSEYGTIEELKTNLKEKGVTFNVVTESTSLEDKQKTAHYEYRQKTGDTRNWGSPWNLFIEPANTKKDGDVLLKKAFVVNGEIIEAEVEKYIRQKLGLPAEELKTAAANKKGVEVCEENKTFKKP